MGTNRELLLRKLTGLLKRITDSDDDYSVTADQRAALMELESLTWNYPSLQQQARGRGDSHDATKDSTDESDDDDDESYYMDIPPYDMTERLKEVNRALNEDPTPAECDRAITIRFREVIADYHSPRDEFPSDSDDGYGDSSDILYDNDDDDGGEIIASLTSGIKGVLGENITDTETSQKETPNAAHPSQTSLHDVSRSDLQNKQDQSNNCLDISGFEGGFNISDEKPLPETTDHHDDYARQTDSPEIEENVPLSSHETNEEITEEIEEDVVNGKSISLLELHDENAYSGSGTGSLSPQNAQDKINFDPTDNCSSMLSLMSKNQIPSELTYNTFEYSDDFEDTQGESDVGEKQNIQSKKESPQIDFEDDSLVKENCESVCEPSSVMKSDTDTERISCSQETQNQSTLKKDLVTSHVKTHSSERRKKHPSPEPKPGAKDTHTMKPKRLSSPAIKPALLSSDKIRTIKTKDSSLRKTNLSISAPSVSSPFGTPDSSSASSSTSVSRSRGRTRTSNVSGPIRPTSHRATSNTLNKSGVTSSGSGGGGPVQSATGNSHRSFAVGSSSSGNKGRPQPPVRVRKAASASDLHNRVVEEADDRRLQNDKVFRAWLRQKNKQAAQTKRQQTPGGRRTAAEVAERRAQAEEAFQVWLSRKRDQLRLEKKLRGERRRLEDQSRYARTKNECDVAYKEWCRRKRDEVRTTSSSRSSAPRSQSLERPWMQEKTRKLYSAYLNNR